MGQKFRKSVARGLVSDRVASAGVAGAGGVRPRRLLQLDIQPPQCCLASLSIWHLILPGLAAWLGIPTAWWSQERCSSCTVLWRSKKWKLRPLSRTGTPSSILNGSRSHRGSPYSRERRKRFHVLMCDEWQVPMQKNTQNGRCGSAHFWKSQFTARGAESG